MFIKKWYEVGMWNTDLCMTNIGFRREGQILRCFAKAYQTPSSVGESMSERGDSGASTGEGIRGPSGESMVGVRGTSGESIIGDLRVELQCWDNDPQEIVYLEDYRKHGYRDKRTYFAALVLEGHQLIPHETGTSKCIRDLCAQYEIDIIRILCDILKV